MIINIADKEKIIGHNLYGKKLTLNPVKSEIIANTNKKTAVRRKTKLEIILSWFKKVDPAHKSPIKIRKIPSIIHSIVMIRLLSVVISPKPLTTDFVGNKCAIPQIIVIVEPM